MTDIDLGMLFSTTPLRPFTMIFERLVQFSNAASPMCFKLSERVIVLKLLQYSNAFAPINCTFSRLISDKRSQNAKACSLIVINEDGRCTFSNVLIL